MELTYTYFACGPALTRENGQLTEGRPLEAEGDLVDNQVKQLIESVNGDSMTVKYSDDATLCVFTTSHSPWEDREYQMNLALRLTGKLKEASVCFPEFCFEIWDQLKAGDEYWFRKAFQSEKPFDELIENSYLTTKNLCYDVRGASKESVMALLASAMNDSKRNVYMICSNRKSICDSLRRIPQALRNLTGFSAPAYGNSQEILTNVVFYEQRAISIKKKARQKIISDPVKADFSDTVIRISEELMEMDAEHIQKLDDLSLKSLLRELYDRCGMDYIEEEDIKVEKKRFPFTKKGTNQLAQRRIFPIIPGKILSVIILLLSVALYVLHNFRVETGVSVNIIISLNTGDLVDISCLLLIGAIVMYFLKPVDYQKDEEE